MQLAVALPYAEGSMSSEEVVEFVRAADRLGFHSVWVAEAWSFDAFMLLTSLVDHTERIGLATGIVNVYSRTPTLLAQSAATLDALSHGRTILGIGTSGPQVIEGWHGMPFDKPVARTRETIEIVRMVLRREKAIYEGEVFRLTKGLRLINHPVRDAVPIVVASLGPRNVEMTAELADGWMPVFFSPSKSRAVYAETLERGRGKRAESLGPLDVMPSVAVCITDEPEGPRQFAKHFFALYIGGMGSRDRNFYNTLFRRYGYESEAREIQDLYLAKRKDEAAARVTDQMVDEVSAIGPVSHVAERLQAFAEAGATVPVLQVMGFDQAHRLQMLEQLSKMI